MFRVPEHLSTLTGGKTQMSSDQYRLRAARARAIVYVDGFNLYFGALKGTPYKWLDLDALARRLAPNDDIVAVRYFTARVTTRRSDPQQRQRQQFYLRALATLPTVTMHFGQHRTHRVMMPLARPAPDGPRRVLVAKTQEKGSDVNLATYLLLDAFQGRCDRALVISNDSDLREPIRVAEAELGIEVVVVNPHPERRRSLDLQSTGFRQLHHAVLAERQLPAVLRDDEGEIHKPPNW